MGEKAYKAMRSAGGSSIAIGVIVMVTGVVCGVLAVINGASLIRHKAELTF